MHLAGTWEHLANHGAKSFYTGDIAREIDEDMRYHEGFLRAEDLALIPWPVERRPIHRTYRMVNVFTSPPPGAGRTLLLVLQILKNLPSRFLKVIVFYDHKPWMVAGNLGSERIFSTMSQFLSHIIDSNRPISKVMIKPRIH